MQTLFTVLSLVLLSLNSQASTCSRTLTFADGAVLTAAQLNAEFNAITNCANSLNDDNISNSAGIDPSKIDSIIAGDGISRDGSTGVLSVGVDSSTIEISSDQLRLKDAGITGAKLGTTAADASTLEVAGGSMRIKDSGVTTAKILDSNVTTAKIADGAVTQAKRAALNIQISGSSGNWGVTNNGSFTDVTNMSVTITTTGRPVAIGFMADGGASPSYIYNACLFKIFRGATEIMYVHHAVTNLQVPVSSLSLVDSPSAGTYTYKLQASMNPGTCDFFNAKMYAYEL